MRNCKDCGTKMVPVFNMMKCPYSCAQKPYSKRCHFPSWWSGYAGEPEFLRSHYPNRSEVDIFKVADAIAVFERTGSQWDDTSKIKDLEILIIRNNTWDRTVGKAFKLTSIQEAAVIENTENCPEEIAGKFGRPNMVCLTRKS